MNTKEDVYKLMGASNHSLTKRAEEDYYSTPLIAVEKLLLELDKLKIKLPNIIIEPSVGDGAIAYPFSKKGHTIMAFDIVDRGFPNTNVFDWLKVSRPNVDNLAVVANFPYKDIQKHTEHSLSILKDGEYLISLAKIQFLEGKARREMFDKFPPKYVLVFSERIKCLANGVDNGSSSAICFCWYIFEKGYNGMPMIDWI